MAKRMKNRGKNAKNGEAKPQVTSVRCEFDR